MQGVGCRVQGVGCRIWHARYYVPLESTDQSDIWRVVRILLGGVVGTEVS